MEELNEQQQMIDAIINNLGNKVSALVIEDAVKTAQINNLEKRITELNELINVADKNIEDLNLKVCLYEETISELQMKDNCNCGNCTCQ